MLPFKVCEFKHTSFITKEKSNNNATMRFCAILCVFSQEYYQIFISFVSSVCSINNIV